MKRIKIIPFKNHKKYLETDLTKEVKDLSAGNYKTLVKETEDDLKKWKTSHAVELEELTLLKYPYYSKQSIDLMWSLSNYL